MADAINDNLEDGEISGSDSDLDLDLDPGAAVGERPRLCADAAFGDRAFQTRATPLPSVTGYRNAAKATESSDSGDSDDEASLWRRKRQKVSGAPLPAPRAAGHRAQPGPRPPAPGAPGGRKVNNIWGSVVQEQCQEAITAELGVFGMEGEVSMASRSVETYNFVLARKIMEKEREEENRSKGEASMLDAQLDEYMSARGTDADGDSKRKRPVKERIGPRAEMDVRGRYEITEHDPAERVIDEIAHRLREPKRELVARVVDVIGARKAIELLGETAALEESGGVYTVDGSRRRTPGGVYLNLLKNTPGVTKAQARRIFLDENQREHKSRKAAQKRRRHVLAKKMKRAINTLNLREHDDVSRETFAGDTNEALESLEEVAEEEEGEEEEEEEEGEEGPSEPALGTEETAVVYSSTDLEVF